MNKHASRHTFRGAVVQLSTSYRLRTAWLQTRTIDPLLSFYYRDGNQCPWCLSIQQWYLQVITCNALTSISSKSYSWYSVHAESDFGKIGRVTSARCRNLSVCIMQNGVSVNGLAATYCLVGQGYGCVWGASLPISSHTSPHLNLFLRLCSLNHWHYSNVNVFREFVPSPSRDLCFDWIIRFFPFWMVKSESATPSKEQQ